MYLSLGRPWTLLHKVALNSVTAAVHVLRRRQACAMLRGVWQCAVLDSGHPGLHAAAALPGYGAHLHNEALDLMPLPVLQTALVVSPCDALLQARSRSMELRHERVLPLHLTPISMHAGWRVLQLASEAFVPLQRCL